MCLLALGQHSTFKNRATTTAAGCRLLQLRLRRLHLAAARARGSTNLITQGREVNLRSSRQRSRTRGVVDDNSTRAPGRGQTCGPELAQVRPL
jgi:hypothetical protein